jgi:hypothetical protein
MVPGGARFNGWRLKLFGRETVLGDSEEASEEDAEERIVVEGSMAKRRFRGRAARQAGSGL